MGKETIIPAITSPKLDVVKAAVAMKEIHEVREGLRGDRLDRFITVRDMLTDDALLKRLDARYYTEAEIVAAFADYLLKNGSRALTADWDAGEHAISTGEIRLAPKTSSTGPEGTMFYDSDDDHVYVATE